MTLTMQIPVRKRMVSATSYTFDFEPREVEVLMVSRSPANCHRTAWFYHAHFTHPDIAAEYPCHPPGVITRWIRRADHPRWKHPVFGPGQTVVTLKNLQQ